MIPKSRACFLLVLVVSSCVGVNDTSSEPSGLRRRKPTSTSSSSSSGGAAAGERIDEYIEHGSYSPTHDPIELMRLLCFYYACMGICLAPFVAVHALWQKVMG